ncbi:MAG: O-antigen ligase family protein [Candidatus Staskawiczbacteria bacterium]|jgi:tetratricopeptide (TPR) repeat protein
MENKNLWDKFYWVYIVGFLLISTLPFWAIPPLLHPAAWGKTIIFRIILSILIFFVIYQIIYRRNTLIIEKLKAKTTRLVLNILALLLFLFLLSTIFSPERSFSFWGNPYRAGGFLNFAFYIAFAILVFSILKSREWKLIWNFFLGTALVISFVAFLEQFKIFGEFLVSYAARPPATLGAPVFLALYLSFFVFLSLSFAISGKTKKKKIFYLASLLIIILAIFLTGARAVFIGLVAAFLYFILFYPNKILPIQIKNPQDHKKFPLDTINIITRFKSFLLQIYNRIYTKRISIIKIITLIFLIFGILGVYYLNTNEAKIFSHPIVAKNQAINVLLSRLKIKMFLEDPRFSFWKIAINSLEEKPLLGYGPENFSIAYDKYFDPSLPYVNYGIVSQVDRAHGFIFDTAVTAGIPALLTFLSLFGVLFWQLQKIKKRDTNTQINTDDTNNPIVVHGVQATLIAYFIGVFFSFDTFDTYLLFFLVVAYSLHLIQNHSTLNNATNRGFIKPERIYVGIIKYRKIIIGFLFFSLIYFVWQYNLKPLFINKELNWADYYSTKGECQKALDRVEKISSSHSFIDHYVLLTYSNILSKCQETNPEREKELTSKSIRVLEDAAKLRPTYTRVWLLLGNYLNFSVVSNPNLKSEEKTELLLRADSYLEKALLLNPKSQRIFFERADTYLLWGKYDEAKKIVEECIEMNASMGDCWVQKANVDIELGELTQAIEDMEKANQNYINVNSQSALSRFLKKYLVAIQDLQEEDPEYYYQPLIFIYSKLATLEPKNFQYHASLAYIFKSLGKYWTAWEEALVVVRISPESKQNVEEFIKTFPEEALKKLPNNGQL